MDRAVSAVRLPPVARFACAALCALAIAAVPVPRAEAKALAPPPVRLAVVWGRPVWSAPYWVRLAPPPGRWEAPWEARAPLPLPILPRSLRGRT